MIAIKDLTVDLGEFMLRDITLDIKDSEYFIILGPTAAGKTVLLEAIAGLYPVVHGEVWVNDREITGISPEKRKIGIVYQDQSLFPHLSVAQNIAFGLSFRKLSSDEVRSRVDNMAYMLGIAHLLERRPNTLSGGEKQRVALGRALVTNPDMLLLDEPLSALDPETKESLQRVLAEVHRRLGVTTMHVTHDFEESMVLGDRVAVLHQGCIAQVGTPEQILRQPNSEFMAHFSLSRNVFSGKVISQDGGYALVDIGGVQLAAMASQEEQVHLSLRPEDVLLSLEHLGSSARNSFPGAIADIVDRGSVVYVTVTLPPDLTCMITRQSFRDLGLQRGMTVWVTFKASSVHVF